MDINHVEHADADANPPDAAQPDLQALLARLQTMELSVNAIQQRNKNPSRNSEKVQGLGFGEIDQLRAEGRCFKCKEKGHMKFNCPNSNPRPQQHQPSFR